MVGFTHLCLFRQGYSLGLGRLGDTMGISRPYAPWCWNTYRSIPTKLAHLGGNAGITYSQPWGSRTAGHRGKKSSECDIEWMIYRVSSELGTMGIIMGDGIQ